MGATRKVDRRASVYDAADGMAREITTTADAHIAAMGQRMTTSETRRVTITAVP